MGKILVGHAKIDLLTLRYFVIADGTLATAFESINVCASLFQMFLANTLGYAFPPKTETGRFQIATHHFYHFALRKAKLKFDRLKGRSVFPGHFDDAIGISCAVLQLFRDSISFNTSSASACF